MPDPDIAILAIEFAEAIMKQNQFINSGDLKSIRYYGNKIGPTARKILKKGDEGRQQLTQLFHHPDRYVRANAAYYLMDSIPQEALAVFKELVASKDSDIVALGAQLRIKELEEQLGLKEKTT